MRVRYAIRFTRSAEKALARLPKQVAVRITAAIAELAGDPRPAGCKKIRGEQGAWRIRVGNYRVVYVVRDSELVVSVVSVGHRRDVYR